MEVEESSPLNSEDESSKSTTFSIILTSYQPSTTPKGKPKKVPKGKELKFAVSDDNYLEFLRAALRQHEESRYTVTIRKPYPFKYFFTKKGDMLDVDKESEYQAMVEKINLKKPTKVQVIIDMAYVQMNCKKAKNEDDDSDEASNPEDTFKSGGKGKLSDLERDLARIRVLLEDNYRTPKGEFLYKREDGDEQRLTSFLMREWAQAIPNSDGFDPIYRQPSIRSSKSEQSLASAPSTPAPQGDMIAFMTRLLDVAANRGSTPVTPTPTTPTRSRTSRTMLPDTSPAPPSPSDLPLYLRFTEDKLGVQDANSYTSPLRCKRYGPDILSLIDESKLTAIGLADGDVLRLKANAADWWKDHSLKKAKRLRTAASMPSFHVDPEPGPSNRDQDADDQEKADNTVNYKLNYGNGGEARYWGPPMKEHDGPPGDRKRRTTYFNEATNEWLPIPDGFTPPSYGLPDP
ncbi:hypothetical protein FA95DRAFT_1576317 [Auriscalpium vulgare]|uniref:Uncharacterized protein n=1 Tax=Auriscalpium vulgare TaxID=40419 RepID=A0ACB8RBQ8_9AGAM|nr:hypothetical protein FA95DRAFT_1576317 [Auriscalpium vulgare]